MISEAELVEALLQRGAIQIKSLPGDMAYYQVKGMVLGLENKNVAPGLSMIYLSVNLVDSQELAWLGGAPFGGTMPLGQGQIERFRLTYFPWPGLAKFLGYLDRLIASNPQPGPLLVWTDDDNGFVEFPLEGQDGP